MGTKITSKFDVINRKDGRDILLEEHVLQITQLSIGSMHFIFQTYAVYRTLHSNEKKTNHQKYSSSVVSAKCTVADAPQIFKR